MNPFESSFSGNYCDHVFFQVDKLLPNESVKADMAGKSQQSFRMTLNKICNTGNRLVGRVFKTKTAADGSLWVKRVE